MLTLPILDQRKQDLKQRTSASSLNQITSNTRLNRFSASGYTGRHHNATCSRGLQQGLGHTFAKRGRANNGRFAKQWDHVINMSWPLYATHDLPGQ
jgi:hypothetical protein